MLVIAKSILRPWVRQNDFAEAFTIILGSIPNFLEPLVGVPAVTGILFMTRHSGAKWFATLSDKSIYFLSIFLASIYVITQEFRVHSIGGNNIYDPNDVVASVLGLALMLGLMLRYGFVRDEAHQSELRE